jgi:hypothetical protein
MVSNLAPFVLRERRTNTAFRKRRNSGREPDSVPVARPFVLGATALNYLEVPPPIRRHLIRISKSKRGIHNLGSGHSVMANTGDNDRGGDSPK